MVYNDFGLGWFLVICLLTFISRGITRMALLYGEFDTVLF